MEESALEALDKNGYTVVDAMVHHQPPPGGSHATPHAFVCMDGNTYWVKAQAQQGLASELIAGRLAERVGAGPVARIIRVPPEALPGDGSANHLEGVNVGTLDLRDAVNINNLAAAGVTTVEKSHIKADARARVVAFQSWIGVGDTQCLVNVVTGEYVSIDHGEVFGDVNNLTDPALCVLEPPGLPRTHGAEATHVAAAVGQVESVTDDELLHAVACVPTGGPWQAERSRRLKIAEWLAHRRAQLREVMKSWK